MFDITTGNIANDLKGMKKLTLKMKQFCKSLNKGYTNKLSNPVGARLLEKIFDIITNKRYAT